MKWRIVLNAFWWWVCLLVGLASIQFSAGAFLLLAESDRLDDFSGASGTTLPYFVLMASVLLSLRLFRDMWRMRPSEQVAWWRRTWPVIHDKLTGGRMEIDAIDVWSNMLALLEREVPRPGFVTWLQPMTGRSFAAGRLVLNAPTDYHAGLVERRLIGSIERAGEQFGVTEVHIRPLERTHE